VIYNRQIHFTDNTYPVFIKQGVYTYYAMHTDTLADGTNIHSRYHSDRSIYVPAEDLDKEYSPSTKWEHYQQVRYDTGFPTLPGAVLSRLLSCPYHLLISTSLSFWLLFRNIVAGAA
jgi:hypothetical protein